MQDSVQDARLKWKFPEHLATPLYAPDPTVAPQEPRDIIEANFPHHTVFPTPAYLLATKSEPGEGGEQVHASSSLSVTMMSLLLTFRRYFELVSFNDLTPAVSHRYLVCWLVA